MFLKKMALNALFFIYLKCKICNITIFDIMKEITITLGDNKWTLD